MKPRIKNHLSVTKKEWNGMVVLIIMIAVVLGAPYVYQQFRKDTIINVKDFAKDVALLNSAKDNGHANYVDETLSDEKTAHPVLFAFNPNDLPADKWKQLGLSERQISIIKHFE